MEHEKNYESAMKSASRMLGRRMHSSCELRRKLLLSGYSQEVVNKLLAELEQAGLLNDARFAEAFAEELAGKGFGKRKIIFQIKKRGISDEIIRGVLENPVFSKDDELESAKKVLQSKMKLLNREKDPRKLKSKLYRSLASSGFSPDIILRAIESL